MPKLGTRDRCIEAGLSIAEYGFEYLTYERVGRAVGLTGAAVKHHFKQDGMGELKAEVIALARRRLNQYVLGQLWARRTNN